MSLRALLVLVLVCGAGLGWLVRSARIQRDAVAAIEHAGGSVAYEWGFYKAKTPRGRVPPVPKWLVDLIGVDYFGHVTKIELCEATDPPLIQVGRLTRAKRLWLDRSLIRDAELAHLKGLSSLTWLAFDNTAVSDAGLVHLNGLTSLSRLDLEGTKVSDEGLVHLKGLINLNGLNLDATQITGAGLVHLKGLTKLSSIGLSYTQVGDDGLMHLNSLTNLKGLGSRGLPSSPHLALTAPRSPTQGSCI
jgi:internalin A